MTDYFVPLLLALFAAALVLVAWRARSGAARVELLLAEQRRQTQLDLEAALQRSGDRLGALQAEDAERLRRALAEAVDGLTRGVNVRLDALGGRVDERLAEGLRANSQTFASVMARLAAIDEAQRRIDALAGDVVSLHELLGDKRARGAFGEVQLEALVRDLLPPDAYEFQATLPNGTRADCVLRLPAPTGLVAVDAKFPLENYRRMNDPDLSEVERRAAQAAFRADLRRHVDAIAGKYIIAGTTADGAVLFVPAESVFAEIHARHPEIVQHALARRVWIVSPTTLMAVLNTARAVLRDAETRRQAHLIRDALAKLGKDFSRFEERLENLARHIEQAGRDVDEARTSARKLAGHFARIEAGALDEAADPAAGAR